MIDVILPVLDEAESLPWVLSRIPPGYRALVVDNGSSDESARIADDLGARVLHEPRRGFGAASYAGLVGAGTEVVCFMDCDGSLDPADLPLVCDPVSAGSAGLCLGARRPTPGAWPAHARLANRVLAVEVNRRTGLRLRDIGPMRAARRDALLGLDLRDRAFRLAARDGPASGAGGLGDPRGRGRLPPASGWRVEGHGHRGGDLPCDQRHVGSPQVGERRYAVVAGSGGSAAGSGSVIGGGSQAGVRRTRIA